jgi:broad specificity phosphatase PhoE
VFCACSIITELSILVLVIKQGPKALFCMTAVRMHYWNKAPVLGRQIGSKCPVPHAKRGKLCAGGGESIRDVAERLAPLLERLEATHSGKTLLLVGHGDTLSILWALVKGEPLTQHRQFGLKTAEWKCLERAQTS